MTVFKVFFLKMERLCKQVEPYPPDLLRDLISLKFTNEWPQGNLMLGCWNDGRHFFPLNPGSRVTSLKFLIGENYIW